VGEPNYLLTLGPHQFYWFALTAPDLLERRDSGRHNGRVLAEPIRWDAQLNGTLRTALESILPGFLTTRSWYTGNGRDITGVRIEDAIEVSLEGGDAAVALVQVEYDEGLPESYVVPLRCVGGDLAVALRRDRPDSIVAEVALGTREREPGVIYDPTGDPDFGRTLLATIARRRRLKGLTGEISGYMTRGFMARGGLDQGFPAASTRLEHNNTTVIFGQELVLKIFRRSAPGLNSDVAIGRFLNERAAFTQVPPVLGYLEYETRSGNSTVAVLQGFVPNEGSAWSYTGDHLRRYLEDLVARRNQVPSPPLQPMTLLQLTEQDPPALVSELFGSFIELARVLGRRTGELHLALASGDEPAFQPEPFTTGYQRSLYQSLRNQTARTFTLLQDRAPVLAPEVQADAALLLQLEDRLLEQFKRVMAHKITTTRIRCHGDYGLEHVLFSGRDFVITDFEGDPFRPQSEQRLKRSPLIDIAGMIRSFDQVAQHALRDATGGTAIRTEDVGFLEPWIRFWVRWVGSAFARAYLHVTAGAPFIPAPREDLEMLFRVLLLEKHVYELGYELNNRPDWAYVPMRGILRILRATE
jgi:maltose alpha-D-glucosyltransferase/alpha-amylase